MGDSAVSTDEWQRRLAAAEARAAAAEAELREGDTRHRLLIESWAQAVWETDAAGVVVADSPSWRAYTGQTLAEWLGYGWFDAIHPDDRAYAERQWREAMAASSPVNAEFRLRAPNGDWRWTNVRAAPLLDAAGAIEKWLGINIDIDDRKRAGAALRESEARYRSLFETMRQGYVENELIRDAAGRAIDFRTLRANPQFERLTGMPAGEAIGRTAREIVTDLDLAWVETYDRVVRTGEPEQFEREEPAFGRWFEVQAYPLAGDRFAILYDDITERKRVEVTLRESEERQAFLLQLSDALRPISDPIAVQEVTARLLGKVMGVDRSYYAEFDWPGDVLHIHHEYVRTDAVSAIGSHPISAFKDLLRFSDEGRPLVCDDIAEHPVFRSEIDAYRARGTDGFILVPLVKQGVMVACLCVTMETPRAWTRAEVGLVEEVAERTWAAVERARAETALRNSEERFRSVSESGVVAVAFFDTGGAITDANDAFLNLVGYTRGEMAAGEVRWDRLTPPEWMPQTRQAVRHYERTGRIEPYEKEYFRKDGERFWALFGGRRIAGSGEGVAFVLDITERKRAEAALRESEARYHALFAASPVPFMVLDANPPDFTILAANEAYFAATLTTRETLIGRRLFDVFTDDPTRPGQLGSEALNISLERVLRTRRTDAMARVRYDIMTPAGGFEEHWWLATNAPLLDEAGDITAIIHQVDRQTELHRAETAIRRNEERQALLLRLSDAFRAKLDPVGMQEEATRLLGESLGVDRALYAEFVDSGDGQFVVIDREYRTAGVRSFEGRHRIEQFGSDGPDLKAGRVVAVDDTELESVSGAQRAVWRRLGVRSRMGVPLVKGGRPVICLGVHSARPRAWTADDIALVREIGERTWEAVQRAHAEEALRQSEMRFREFGEASQDVLWIRDADTLQWTYLTPAFEAIYGVSRDEALSGENYRNWLDLIVPADRARAAENIARVRAGEHATFDYRVRRPSDGTIRWLRNTDFPITDASGKVALIGGIAHDATDLKRAQERHETLLAELQHRVRNILAVTRSIISRSDDGERSTEDYVQHLQGRIAALARTQVLLTRSAGADIDLEDLIRDELVAQAASPDQVSLNGIDVALSPKVAEVLTLAIHELATNATKYGAFSRPGGRLDVDWRVETRDGQDWLVLTWRERGVPIVDAAPRRRGFGAELISRRIPYELKGHGSLELKPGGVDSRIEFPLIAGESTLQTDAGGR